MKCYALHIEAVLRRPVESGISPSIAVGRGHQGQTIALPFNRICQVDKFRWPEDGRAGSRKHAFSADRACNAVATSMACVRAILPALQLTARSSETQGSGSATGTSAKVLASSSSACQATPGFDPRATFGIDPLV